MFHSETFTTAERVRCKLIFVIRRAILLTMLASGLPAVRISCSPADFGLLHRAADARIRADGRWVVYVDTWSEPNPAAEYSNLHLVSTDGRERRPYTEGRWRDWSPRWSPDGSRLAWISDRSGRPQILVGKFEGSSPIALTGETISPLAFSWSADGEAIAIVAQGASPTPPPAWAPASILPYLSRRSLPSRILFVPAAGGTAREVPTGKLVCTGEPSWMLDGKALVAACGDGIYLLPIGATGPKRLTKDAGRYESPQVSPDGGRIAYLFAENKQQSYVARKVYVMNADGTRERVLSGSLDRDASDPQWSSESRTVYFVADDRGSTHVYAARNDGTVRQVTAKPERLDGLSLADNGRAASVRSSATEARDVVSFTVDVVSQPVTLAAPNEHLLADRDLGAVEEISYPSAGQTIQAWLVKPPAFDASRKYPLLVDAADDPRRMYGVEFDLRAQVLAAAGFVVLRANPRGAPGYGEQFGNLLRTRYPGDDFEDLLRGVDAVVAKGFIDPARIHIAGGLLSAWAIGHTTRFRSAVARRPIVDWSVDVALAADGARRATEWMGAMPWEDPDQYVKHSPVYFAREFKTPTLILSGESDPQSRELEFALRSRGVEAELVRIPAGPRGAVLEMETILAWLKK